MFTAAALSAATFAGPKGLVSCQPSARFDDGWWSSAGGIGSFGKSHPTIRMVGEDLRITLEEGSSPGVDVTFIFHNDGPATRVTMAFPEEYTAGRGKSLDHFRTWVDSSPATASRKVIEKGDPDDDDSRGSAVWLKEVPFAAGQTRTVRVAYSGIYGGNAAGDVWLDYILKSGASWKGPIGACTITVNWSHLKTLSAPYCDLRGAVWSPSGKREMRTVLKRWKPDQDLDVTMVPGLWNFSIGGQPVDPIQARRAGGRPYVVGSAEDPMLPAWFGLFFGAWVTNDAGDRDWTEWKNPVCAKFGGHFDIEKGKLTLPSGAVVALKRGFKMVPGPENTEPIEFVYLKDVVEALGGRFTFRDLDQRVDVGF